MPLGITTIVRPDLLRGTGKVVLSYDDGPNPRDDLSYRLLDVLDRFEARATFCVIGTHVEESPEIVQEYARRGHTIGNHSYSHSFPLLQPEAEIIADFGRGDAAIRTALNREHLACIPVRPPYGVMWTRHIRGSSFAPKKMAAISFFVNDVWLTCDTWRGACERIWRNLHHRNGGAVVLHERRLGGERLQSNARTVDRSWVLEATSLLLQRIESHSMRVVPYGDGCPSLGQGVRV